MNHRTTTTIETKMMIHSGRVIVMIEYGNVMRRVSEYQCNFDVH